MHFATSIEFGCFNKYSVNNFCEIASLAFFKRLKVMVKNQNKTNLFPNKFTYYTKYL